MSRFSVVLLSIVLVGGAAGIWGSGHDPSAATTEGKAALTMCWAGAIAAIGLPVSVWLDFNGGD